MNIRKINKMRLKASPQDNLVSSLRKQSEAGLSIWCKVRPVVGSPLFHISDDTAAALHGLRATAMLHPDSPFATLRDESGLSCGEPSRLYHKDR